MAVQGAAEGSAGKVRATGTPATKSAPKPRQGPLSRTPTSRAASSHLPHYPNMQGKGTRMSAYTDARSKSRPGHLAGDERVFMDHFSGGPGGLRRGPSTDRDKTTSRRSAAARRGISRSSAASGMQRTRVRSSWAAASSTARSRSRWTTSRWTRPSSRTIDGLLNHYGLSAPYARQLGEEPGVPGLNGHRPLHVVLASRETATPLAINGPPRPTTTTPPRATDASYLERGVPSGGGAASVRTTSAAARWTYFLPWSSSCSSVTRVSTRWTPQARATALRVRSARSRVCLSGARTPIPEHELHDRHLREAIQRQLHHDRRRHLQPHGGGHAEAPCEGGREGNRRIASAPP